MFFLIFPLLPCFSPRSFPLLCPGGGVIGLYVYIIQTGRNHMSLSKSILRIKKTILLWIVLFLFFAPNSLLAGCSDATVSAWWHYKHSPMSGFQGITRIGQCWKLFRGCKITHCNKTKQQIMDLLVQALKRQDGAGRENNWFCITNNRIGVASGSSIDVSSWGVPLCYQL